MSIIDSLKVEGNIPCPTPATITRPLPRRKSGSFYENPSAKPVKIKHNIQEKHINSEEDIKNILMQAKAPALVGPTIIAKRMGFMSKIKQLNDGMYKHLVIADDKEQPKRNELTLEGRKVDSKQKSSSTLQIDDVRHDECETDDSKMDNGLPTQSVKSTHNSAKSYHSIRSAKSDPGIIKPLALPALTIGAERHKTKGEYMAGSGDDINLHSLTMASSGKGMVRGEQDEYEFRFTTPRKFRLRGENRDIHSPDSTGNYGSLSLRDLKACLHVNHSSERSSHQEFIVQNYMKRLKTTQKRSGFKVNPYKMLKTSPRNRNINGVSPRYEFNSVESYLHFNRQKQEQIDTLTASGQPIQNKSHADTVVLQVMTDLNNPTVQRHATVASSRLSSKDQSELLQIKPQTGTEKINQSTVNSPCSISGTTAPKTERQILQHIVYVPSGQTSRVRLLKS